MHTRSAQTQAHQIRTTSAAMDSAQRKEMLQTYYDTLMVPTGNVFLQAGPCAVMKHKDANGNHGSVASYIAREWMIVCGKPEINKLFDETARTQIKEILELAQTPKEMQMIFRVAQTRILKHGNTGIIKIRMAPNYKHLEDQIVQRIRTN